MGNRLLELAPDVLKGWRIGISVSESADLKRLGLLEIHFRLALAEIARCVLVMGGGLSYGGQLKPDGYSPFLMRELEKYGHLEGSLHACLAWHAHRERTLSELDVASGKLGSSGKLICLDQQGKEINRYHGRTEAAETIADPEVRKNALTALRKYMCAHTNGRVLLGGKRHGFHGAQPGLLEEARLALEAKQALYLAGGFGGVTLDIAQIIDARCKAVCEPRADDPALDWREQEGLAALAALVDGAGWGALNNGLNDEENLRLAATHRPSEIAALVCLGFGRITRNLTVV